MNRARTGLLYQCVPPVLLLAVVLALWQLLVTWYHVPAFVLPSPMQVAQRGWEQRESLLSATGHTAAAALGGFAMSLVLGVLIAILFSQSKMLRAAMIPYAIFFQTVPIVAIAPLLIKWISDDYFRVAVVALVISIFPIITAATTGLIRVDPSLGELFTLYRASRWQRLWNLQLPSAVPYLITGAKTACGLAVVGAIVGEFYAGAQSDAFGLGYLIPQAVGQLKTDLLLAAIVCSTLLGVATFALVSWIGSAVLTKWYGSEK
jgi:NitT/TauT family transport system permease protein